MRTISATKRTSGVRVSGSFDLRDRQAGLPGNSAMVFHDPLLPATLARKTFGVTVGATAAVLVMLVGPPSAAKAACTPAPASNITATCTGTTLNQGGGAPGTSAGADGYGDGVEIGITVNVAAGAANTVTGASSGILYRRRYGH